MPIQLAPQTCDATHYLMLGQACAGTFKDCWDPLRPMGAAFYFSVPFRLGLPEGTLLFLNSLLALASLASGVLAVIALLPRTTRICQVALTLALLCVYVFFMGTPLWNSLSDAPATAMLVLSVWLLVLGGIRDSRSLYAGAGAALGAAVSLRAFYLYPALAAASCLALLVLVRKDRPARVGLFCLALMAPIALQLSVTHHRTGVWSFIDETTRARAAALHFETAMYGYDTINTGICPPSIPWCCGSGWQYDASECFQDSNGMGNALRKHEWGEVGCLLLRRQWFYFGSFTKSGKVYLSSELDRHFSHGFLVANIVALIAALTWSLRTPKRAWLLVTPLLLLGAIWGLASMIIPEGRFLMAFHIVLWTLTLAGATNFVFWLRDRRSLPPRNVQPARAAPDETRSPDTPLPAASKSVTCLRT